MLVIECDSMPFSNCRASISDLDALNGLAALSRLRFMKAILLSDCFQIVRADSPPANEKHTRTSISSIKCRDLFRMWYSYIFLITQADHYFSLSLHAAQTPDRR